MGEGVAALQPSFAALSDVALAVCAGVLLLRGFIPKRSVVRAMGAGLAALAIGLLGGLWLETASMSGAEGAAVWDALPLVLRQTSFGHAMAAAGVAWCVLAASIIAAMAFRQRAWPCASAWSALAVLCVARAAAGHAMDDGWAGYAVWIHAVHVAAGAAWAGTVFCAAGLSLSWRDWAVPQRLEMAQHISHVATVALIAVAASGAVNTWRMLGGADISFGQPYVRLLAFKLACVGLAACMGAYNRWRVMPALMEKGAARRFATVLLVEGVVLLAAMLLAAQLAVTMPPM